MVYLPIGNAQTVERKEKWTMQILKASGKAKGLMVVLTKLAERQGSRTLGEIDREGR